MTEVDLRPLNRTELYQLCRQAGIFPPPNAPNEKMISYLLGTEEVSGPNVFDNWRDAIMSFLLAHWKSVETQLTCPAKSGDPKSCYQCVDAQVISCIVQQSAPDQQLIQLKRK